MGILGSSVGYPFTFLEMVDKMNTRDLLFREWCTTHGVSNEAVAYEIWCAAWRAAKGDEAICICVHPQLCDFNDKCMKEHV